MKNEPWVAEILLGQKPAKTLAYRDRTKRREIIDLFVKIQAVNSLVSSKEDRKLMVDLFRRNDEMIAKLRRTVEYCYESNGQKPVRIIFLQNEILRVDVIESDSKKFVYVKVPVIKEDW